MTHSLRFTAILGALFTTALVLAYLLSVHTAFGSSPSGLQATIASSTNPSIGAGSAVVIIATSTCNARIITTENSAVMLTFSDYNGATPTGSFGHWQAASTTVAYDSGQYGCGLVKAFSYTAQLLTVSDVR